MNLIGHKYIFLTISGILVLVSIVALMVWGLKFGIDFTGGSLLEVEFFESRPDAAKIREILEPLDLGNISVQPTGERGMILRFAHVNEAKHQQILGALNTGSGVEGVEDGKPQVESSLRQAALAKRFDTIGPTIGRELYRNSMIALGLAIIAIILYIAFAFRHVSKPVSSWKYGVSAVIALVHDVMIPTGIFAVLGNFWGVEVDTLFITALLTILGFSVHDTIVVFDRIRENLRKPAPYRTEGSGAGLKSPEPFEITVNRSVNETITRSINTSFTVLLVLVAIMAFGGVTTRYFALALILGIVFGTYSSIFVASPILVIWQRWTKNK